MALILMATTMSSESNENALRFHFGKVLEGIQQCCAFSNQQMSSALAVSPRQYKLLCSGSAPMRIHITALVVSEFGVPPELFFAGTAVGDRIGLSPIFSVPDDLPMFCSLHRLSLLELSTFQVMVTRLTEHRIHSDTSPYDLHIPESLKASCREYLTDPSYYQRVSDGLLRFRRKSMLTLCQFADSIDVPLSTLKRILSGKHQLDLVLWAKFADGFNVSPMVVNDPASPYGVARTIVTRRCELLLKLKAMPEEDQRLITIGLNGLLHGSGTRSIPVQ